MIRQIQQRVRLAGERRRLLVTWGPAVLVACLLFASAPWLMEPPCPRHLVIATGGVDGNYYAVAQRYREILARDGITLEVRSTAGSAENLALIESDESGVTLGLVQGGVKSTNSQAEADVKALASLYLEPIWIFSRSNQAIHQLSDLAGKRVAVGQQGSGTRAVMRELLSSNGLKFDAPPSDSSEVHLIAKSGSAGVKALFSNDVDAVCLVISPESPLIADLLARDDVELMHFRRAGAYERRYPYLASVQLAEGVVDLSRNLPRGELTLLAPTANLVARADLHPALVSLLLGAARKVHRGGGLLSAAEVFPSPGHTAFPLHKDAQRYFESGPPLFYRHLPFRVAAWLDRMKMLLLPLGTLLLPLFKAAPPVYRWRIRSKIFRWYRVLRRVDQKIRDSGTQVDFSKEIEELEQLEIELAEVTVPLSYMEEFYNLRLHVAYVLDQLAKQSTARATKLRLAA